MTDNLPSTAHCPICSTDITENYVVCERCETPHHKDCFCTPQGSKGGCGIYACGSDTAIEGDHTVQTQYPIVFSRSRYFMYKTLSNLGLLFGAAGAVTAYVNGIDGALLGAALPMAAYYKSFHDTMKGEDPSGTPSRACILSGLAGLVAGPGTGVYCAFASFFASMFGEMNSYILPGIQQRGYVLNAGTDRKSDRIFLESESLDDKILKGESAKRLAIEAKDD